jgi:hypothetical protein
VRSIALAHPRTGEWARLALTTALALYGALCIARPEVYRLLDGVDLLIHEAGHVVFAPFGEFVGFLGGTLLQLLLPAAFLVSFLRRGEPYAATVVLWWIAQNLWNISVYMRDARSQALPLVGGGEHDWGYLLGRLGLLEHDQTLGGLVQLLGIFLFGVAILQGFHHARARPAAEVST